MKKLLVVLLVFAVLAGVGASQAYSWYQWEISSPTGPGTDPVVFHVDPEESSQAIADALAATGLVRDPQVVRLYLKLNPSLGAGIQAGDHLLRHSMSLEQILAALDSTSQQDQLSVTFPEGLTTAQMAVLAAQAGIVSTAQDYVQATQSTWTYPFLASRPAGASLEGFLFPDTYSIDRTGGARQLVQRQLERFGQVVGGWSPTLGQATAERPPESLYAVLILASIVEREVDTDADRGPACSVYYNRLQAGMPLQVDATVLYALGVWKKVVTEQDRTVNSPYNTFLHLGLPPGPIGNPGAASIQACVNPPQTSYLYYFSDRGGVTHFERTLADFARDQERFGLSGE